MKRVHNLVLVGLGRAGAIHFKNIFESKRANIKYAFDIDPAKIKAYKDEYPDDRIQCLLMDKFDVALTDPTVDGVIICTHTDTHEELIMKSLKNGKAVFCEKPLSPTVEGTVKCYEFAEKMNLPLHCSLNRRFDPSVLEVYKAINSGKLGRIHMIKTTSRDNPRPTLEYLKVSNGIFHDCAVHDLDMVSWLLNKKIKSVYVSAFTEDPEIAQLHDAETVAINLTFADGTLGMIDLSRVSTSGYDQRIEVHGSQGTMKSKNQKSENWTISSSNGIMNPFYKESFPQRYRDSYINSLNYFMGLIENGQPSSVSKQEVLDLAKLATACEESVKLRKSIDL